MSKVSEKLNQKITVLIGLINMNINAKSIHIFVSPSL